MKLKLATYNMAWLQGKGSDGVEYERKEPIHFTSGLSMVSRFVLSNNIDFIGIQEIDICSKRSHDINQVAELEKRLGFNSVTTITWDLPFLPFPYLSPWGRIKSGGSSFSSSSIAELETLSFSAPKEMSYLKRKFYLNRYIQVVKLTKNNKEVIIFNLHLEAFVQAEKCRQLIELKRLIKKYNPHAVMGDFNTIPHQAIKKKFKYDDYSKDEASVLLPEVMNGYIDPFPENLTYPTVKPDRRLDYIWVRNDLKFTLDKFDFYLNPSDHIPLVLTINI